ncbi:MAG: hypothetical protein ABIP95_08610 [Pelobium sp.]
MKTFTNSKFSKENENFGGEFSILTSNQYSKQNEVSSDKSIAYTSFLYILSILSITCWIVSLRMLPFGDMFQFLLGAVVLTVNLMVFKWTKL